MTHASVSAQLRLIVALLVLLAAACGGDEPARPGGTNAAAASGGTGMGTSAANSSITSGTTNAAVHAGSISASNGSNSSSVASGTSSSTGGIATAATIAATSTTSAGGMSGTGSAEQTTSAASSTGGSGTTLMGGASAEFVCEVGATYGDPLAGMGAVQEIPAPSPSYFAFIEGPVWVGSVGTLFFSDNASSPDERIWKLVPPSTTPEIFLEPSGSNGLAIDNNDQLILADQANQQIVQVDSASGQVLGTIAGPGNYRPNDVIVRSDDNIYFTDPDTGFYRVSPQGEVTDPIGEVSRPNGIVLSPDEGTLYVGDVGNRQIHAFQLGPDGSVGVGSVFTTATNNTVDGMAVDCAGNVYAGTANGVEVFSPNAEYIGTVPTGESSNATFGGSDRTTLYVTSRAVLKYVTLAVPGLPD